MKKNTMMRIASVLLIAVLMTTCVISGTFAKYAASAEGTDTVTVAKWAFNVGTDNNIADAGNLSKTFDFNLFNTIKDTLDSNEEGDVATNMIAPGTQGAFAIELQNISDVTASYAIVLDLDNAKGIPLEFSLDGTNWDDDLPTIPNNDLLFQNDPETDADDTKATVTVHWRWAIGTPGSDNAFGVVNTPIEVTVSATITVEQVD